SRRRHRISKRDWSSDVCSSDLNYLARTVDSALDELMPFESAIAIDGPKGVGKTATAARRATKTWRADIAAERAILEADPLFADRSEERRVGKASGAGRGRQPGS